MVKEKIKIGDRVKVVKNLLDKSIAESYKFVGQQGTVIRLDNREFLPVQVEFKINNTSKWADFYEQELEVMPESKLLKWLKKT